ncbi:MAG: signal recognition particle-docking protein FtsY [Firmicutes bacterium]|nr:signal recognition particle-docking protein FtsY [Bacillota bacterium]
MGFFESLKRGLAKTRNSLMSGFDVLFGAYDEVDDDFFEELEEILVLSDMGMETAARIVAQLEQETIDRHLTRPAQVRKMLLEDLEKLMGEQDNTIVDDDRMSILMMIGVNGAGKTTTIGKLALQLKEDGRKVILAAADTFRAAAIDQLQVWADRAGVEMISHQEGSDPGAVVYDAAAAAKSRHADVLICDTAGRLQNKKNLMNELSKLFRILEKEFPDARREVLLVLDATTGQNALQQARLFSESAPITGIILTKLDGTAKGGVVISIASEMQIPVKYIGVGEKIEDLQPFRPKEFLQALLAEE